MIRMLSFTVAVLLVPGIASAEQYWIAYEGNDFPENVGWRRHYGNENGPYEGGAERWIEDGVFVLDSLRHHQIYDFYDIERSIDPGPGEVFVAEWRVSVEESIPEYDVGVSITRDDPPGFVLFRLRQDEVYIWTEGVSISLGESGFHTYRLESCDMQSYSLVVDDVIMYYGMFDPRTFSTSRVSFGDNTQGARSLSRWDYLRFGVVPEPGTVVLLGACALIACRRCVCARAPRTLGGALR
jgi:hypothetical protein